ncbi:hypothetical protein WMY93_031297 [Mugilogobius chulae]|uniref:Fucolectin tachylectin-4 pentraxin-1 domain-containing protein n=1 Tax=Mugilogobius chulae TaxID=88201 RepID=A0AAW0MDN4_9GOBI
MFTYECILVSSPPAEDLWMCFGHLGQDRGRAVNRSPPGCEMDLLTEEEAGQTCVATFSPYKGQIQTLTLTEPVEGRYVNVFLPGTNKYLTLCEVEVYGSKRDVNVALGGEATQIDTYEIGAASNAIDGKRDSVFYHHSCSHTLTSTDPWWRLDMKQSHTITSITVTNRKDCCAERLDGAQIRVGNSLENNGNDNPLVATVSHIAAGRSQSFMFPSAVEGRYVNIYLPGTDKYLTLCEVEVYGLKGEVATAAPEDTEDERPS